MPKSWCNRISFRSLNISKIIIRRPIVTEKLIGDLNLKLE